LTRWQRVSFAAALVALAVVSSWTGLFNGFTYDDTFIVLNNTAMHDLRNWWRFFGMAYWPAQWGNDGYRPLTILAYSLEWAAGHGKPWIFHAVNIGLYSAVSMAVFYLAETCLPFAAAWMAAALFAVHPVHVEAVANVVGQSELLAALFLIPAVALYIRRRNANELTIGPMLAIAALYAAACLSKEHGIVLPALLLAAEVIVVVDRTPLRARLTALRPFALSLALVAVVFLAAHAHANQEITGFHPYVPFVVIGVGAMGRVFTMVGLVPEWLRLFLWPLHLASEYGPPADPVATGFQLYQVPGLVALVGTLALGVAAWRKAPAVSFGIWFLVIALLPTSNFILPAGILLSERTLFMPSVGAMIALAAVVPWFYRHARSQSVRIAGLGALEAVLAFAAWRSMERTRVWKDNDTLFAATVVDAPYVYRSHFMLGAHKLALKHMVEGEREYQSAIELYDSDPFLFYSLAEEYRLAGMYKAAIANYRRALAVDSTMYEAHARLALSLAGLERWPEANREAIIALSEDTRSSGAMLRIIRLAAAVRKRAGAAHFP
jgi:protein O-mannosyl-transferase